MRIILLLAGIILFATSSQATVFYVDQLLWIAQNQLAVGTCAKGQIPNKGNCISNAKQRAWQPVFDVIVRDYLRLINTHSANLEDEITRTKIKHPDVVGYWQRLQNTVAIMKEKKNLIAIASNEIQEIHKLSRSLDAVLQEIQGKLDYYLYQRALIDEKLKSDPDNTTLKRMRRANENEISNWNEKKKIAFQKQTALQQRERDLRSQIEAHQMELVQLETVREQQQLEFDEVFRRTDVTSQKIEWLQKRIQDLTFEGNQIGVVEQMLREPDLLYNFVQLSAWEKRVVLKVLKLTAY
ncbi:MAG: hypothetical protein KDD61_07925 [Bdellovibrionales bacterium]|nr:hypothetical protein [Bdellovibrionales bacterium]